MFAAAHRCIATYVGEHCLNAVPKRNRFLVSLVIFVFDWDFRVTGPKHHNLNISIPIVEIMNLSVPTSLL